MHKTNVLHFIDENPSCSSSRSRSSSNSTWSSGSSSISSGISSSSGPSSRWSLISIVVVEAVTVKVVLIVIA